VADAISVIEIDEVIEARTVPAEENPI